MSSQKYVSVLNALNCAVRECKALSGQTRESRDNIMLNMRNIATLFKGLSPDDMDDNSRTLPLQIGITAILLHWRSLSETISENEYNRGAHDVSMLMNCLGVLSGFSHAIEERERREKSETSLLSHQKLHFEEVSSLKKEISELKADLAEAEERHDAQRAERRQRYLASLEAQLRNLENT